MTDYIVHTDGSNSHKRGEGPAGSAFVAWRKDIAIESIEDLVESFETWGRNILSSPGIHLEIIPHKIGTNNFAELYAIQKAVEWFGKHADAEDTLSLRSDSEWCILTIAYKFELKSHKKPYKTLLYPDMYRAISKWVAPRISFHWVPREDNTLADRLAVLATERAKERYT